MTDRSAMWICAITLNHGDGNLEDRWTVHPTEAEARGTMSAALDRDNLHCAAVAQISHGTEPHWMTGL